jgi:nicotinic acid phosphoribosyltransferase
MRKLGITPRLIVFEDEVSPEIVHQVYDHFREATGEEPTMLFPGAGGYWWRLVHRDTVAAAFKRTATKDHPNVKFSNSPGKETLGGYLRVYGRDDALIVADASEPPQGEPLYVKLVEAGKIVYRESFQDQAARADRTWGRYKRVELSPVVHEYQERFRTMRDQEIGAARNRLRLQ